MSYYPVKICFSGTAQQIAVVVAGVIIPDGIVHFPNLISIHGVEDVLIRQEQACAVFGKVRKHIFRQDLCWG